MAGRVLNFDANAHHAVELLLPWFVNGTLSGEELTQVEQHVRECRQCKREVEWLRTMQACYAENEVAVDSAASFQKLLPQLDPPGRRRLLPHWTSLWQALQPFRWPAAAAFALTLALGALLLPTLKPAAPYHTLGAADAPAPVLGSVVVVFEPGTTSAELNRILRVNQARVVDGPTVTGAYMLALPAGRQEAVLQALRRENAVKLAERLGPEGER